MGGMMRGFRSAVGVNEQPKKQSKLASALWTLLLIGASLWLIYRFLQ